MAQWTPVGLFPPLVTPFDDAGAIDLDALRRNLQGYAAAPLGGYVVLGTNGEFAHLTRAEKEAVIEAVVGEAGDRPVLAQVGEGSLRGTLDLARRAADLGASAILAVTPHYYRTQMTDQALIDFYRALADASPLPVLLYNIPQNTGVNVSPAVVSACAQHPRIIGIKDSSGNLGQIAEFIERTPAGWGVCNGSSSLAVAACLAGAPGAVLGASNVLPFETCDLFALCRDGRWADATALEARLRPVVRALSRLGVAGVKLGMDMVGFRGGLPRAPLSPVEASQREGLADALRAAGLIRF